MICGEHGALARDALRRAHAEQLGACLDESDAARGAGAAVNREIGPYRIAAARAHDSPLRIGIDREDAHVAPFDFELVSEDAGDGRAYVLAHFRADDVHGHDAIAVDAVPNRGLEGARTPTPAAAPSVGAKPNVAAAPARPIRKTRRESAL